MKQRYQPDYEPSQITGEDRGALHAGIVRGLGDEKIANLEVNRVARNIARALDNPNVPAVVRAHIKAYLSKLFYWDMTGDPKSALALYPIACRRISQVPFVPLQDFIEALTGQDRAAAIKAARMKRFDDWHEQPFESVTGEHMARLVKKVLTSDRDETNDGVQALVALMYCLASERSSHHRWVIADDAMREVFGSSDASFYPRRSFIAQAIKLYGK
jgi:hypothetical protein